MHDLAYFRSNFAALSDRLATRGNVPGLDRFRDLDRTRRSAVTQTEQLKARRNTESAEIGKLRQEGADTTERQKQMRAIGDEIASLDQQVKVVDAEWEELLAGIPNVPHESENNHRVRLGCVQGLGRGRETRLEQPRIRRAR